MNKRTKPKVLSAARIPRSRRPLALLAATALATAVAAGVSIASARSSDAPEPLTPPAERERATLSAPYLTRAGSLPDQPVQSVQKFPVPFTFQTPQRERAGHDWNYALFEGFDIGDGASGMTVLAPTKTYAPEIAWRGQEQGQLVPAPTDAAGWEAWLERTGFVEIKKRGALLIGGAPATRFTLDLQDLPPDYDCGGARRCLAIAPMRNPHAGPSDVGSGAQTGIEDATHELTVIEVEGRAVVVLATGKAETKDEWLPTLRDVIASLRFA